MEIFTDDFKFKLQVDNTKNLVPQEFFNEILSGLGYAIDSILKRQTNKKKIRFQVVYSSLNPLYAFFNVDIKLQKKQNITFLEIMKLLSQLALHAGLDQLFVGVNNNCIVKIGWNNQAFCINQQNGQSTWIAS